MSIGEIYMKYFCKVSDKKGTCYHEWQKGKWDEERGFPAYP